MGFVHLRAALVAASFHHTLVAAAAALAERGGLLGEAGRRRWQLARLSARSVVALETTFGARSTQGTVVVAEGKVFVLGHLTTSALISALTRGTFARCTATRSKAIALGVLELGGGGGGGGGVVVVVLRPPTTTTKRNRSSLLGLVSFAHLSLRHLGHRSIIASIAGAARRALGQAVTVFAVPRHVEVVSFEQNFLRLFRKGLFAISASCAALYALNSWRNMF